MLADCKEYFNCRSTREFRAHIRRSTDLSHTTEGLLAFSETKNKEACRDDRERGFGFGNVRVDAQGGLILVWRAVKNLMRGVTAHVHQLLPWLLRFFREIKIQRRDSSRRANWNILGNPRGGKEGVTSTPVTWVDCYIDISGSRWTVSLAK